MGRCGCARIVVPTIQPEQSRNATRLVRRSTDDRHWLQSNSVWPNVVQYQPPKMRRRLVRRIAASSISNRHASLVKIVKMQAVRWALAYSMKESFTQRDALWRRQSMDMLPSFRMVTWVPCQLPTCLGRRNDFGAPKMMKPKAKEGKLVKEGIVAFFSWDLWTNREINTNSSPVTSPILPLGLQGRHIRRPSPLVLWWKNQRISILHLTFLFF